MDFSILVVMMYPCNSINLVIVQINTSVIIESCISRNMRKDVSKDILHLKKKLKIDFSAKNQFENNEVQILRSIFY